MSYNNPSSLLQLAIQSLLRDDNLTITSLKHLPAEVFPSLFLEAHIHRRRETLKALVQTWPFERLPLGALLQDGQPEDPRFKAVMDGIDVLLKQEVPHRCKLRVLDLQFTGQKFWRMWTGVDLPVFSERRKLVDEGPSRNKKAKPYFEVCVDLYISRNHADRLSNYLLDWIRERKGVHLSCKTVMIYSLTRKSFRFLHAMPFCDIKELGIHCTLTFSTLRLLGIQLGMMNNLKRLDVCIDILAATTPEEDDWMPVCISEFTSAFHQLLHLQELYLKSPFFLQGHLHQLIRVTEGDLTHLFQSPHITHLKDLCLRGLPLTSVSEPLRALLEVNAATLQHLDLGLCGLQDPQLEALLPALSSCSQLSSLSLHGNRLSMATLEKLLRCTSGLSRLRQEIYPAPMETFNPQGILQPQTFDLLCTHIFKILKELKHSRSIVVSTGRCSYCARKMFRNWKLIILPCLSCFRDYKKLSFRPTGSE
ncbi:PRAME family member 7-like [Erinaceus europaeus]|uniref:PRAME family member 7-like n=1 Tax=Erinaceus europaeus TaxID=9365 RepID=A0ABM3YBB7_ERIEU|nr:PRAME family member 7-like [Erinaceus europaeus]